MTARLARVSTPVLLLVAAAATSAGLLLVLQSHITFFLDDWDLLLHRRGFDADAFLRPHNEHIIVGPTIVYKALQATLGMDSPRPYQVVGVATFVTSAVLLFVWLRPRVGEWLALFGAVAILFLGTAWEDLLSPFQVGFFGSVSFGLGTLLALERGTRRADLLACALLTGSVAFSSLGLPFLAGAAAAIALGPRETSGAPTAARLGSAPLRLTWARRGFVVAIPAVLFALWWLGWGHEARSTVDFESIVTAPGFALDGFASGLASLLGLAPPDNVPPATPVDWGRPLLLVAIGLVAWRIQRLGRVPRGLWVVAAIAVGFWLLAGVNAAAFRPPITPRYMYIAAIVWIMIAAELLRGVRPSRTVLVAVVVVGIATVASNLVSLREGYRAFRATSETERGGITALEIARDTVEPGFLLTEENANTPFFDYVDAQSYLSAVDAFGSPAYTEAELAIAPEGVREAADKALAAALRLGLAPAPGGGDGGCEALEPAVTAEDLTAFGLGPGRYLVEAREGGAEVSARRFSASFPAELGRLGAGEAALLEIPSDRAETPWALRLAGAGQVSACEPG